MHILKKIMFNTIAKEIKYQNKVNRLQRCACKADCHALLIFKNEINFFLKMSFKGWICHVTYCLFF